jgi:hypothetical protein
VQASDFFPEKVRPWEPLANAGGQADDAEICGRMLSQPVPGCQDKNCARWLPKARLAAKEQESASRMRLLWHRRQWLYYLPRLEKLPADEGTGES